MGGLRSAYPRRTVQCSTSRVSSMSTSWMTRCPRSSATLPLCSVTSRSQAPRSSMSSHATRKPDSRRLAAKREQKPRGNRGRAGPGPGPGSRPRPRPRRPRQRRRPRGQRERPRRSVCASPRSFAFREDRQSNALRSSSTRCPSSLSTPASYPNTAPWRSTTSERSRCGASRSGRSTDATADLRGALAWWLRAVARSW